MFELVPQPEFSAWFAGLPEPLAEEVASALELLARAGEAFDPARVSRALLVYDGTGTGATSELWHRGGLALALVESARGMQAIRAWQSELLSCLGSAPLRARLERLSSGASQEALASVERLRQELRAWERELVLRLGSGHVSPERVATRKAELTQAFGSVLELVGLSPSRFLELASGLRELTITTTEPSLHVIFGVDTAARRLLVLLGEPLTRAYYGDSVRRAEARWARYQRKVADEQSP